MSTFNADNSRTIDSKVQKELNIQMVDNGAYVPYTDVIVDCSGSMGADMGGVSRVMFTMNLLKTLLEKKHVTMDTLVHGFDSSYRGCVPLNKLLKDISEKKIIDAMFYPGGGTTPSAALKHVSDVTRTLGILDMYTDNDLKRSFTTPYDLIFYGAPYQN